MLVSLSSFPSLSGGINNSGCSLGDRCIEWESPCEGRPKHRFSLALPGHQENGGCHATRVCFALPDLEGPTPD